MSYHTLPAIDEDTALACAARASHEVNRTFSLALGEPALPSWDGLPNDLQKSLLNGVMFVRQGATPRQCHEEWMRYKLAEGWSWGEEKSSEKKTSPYLLAWECLTEAQRRKDELFVSVTRSMLLACGMTLQLSTAA
jgi:hypothetical protein